MLKLLKLQPGEKVSFEKFEDIGVETEGKRIYYQQKHTVKGTINKPINMAKRDDDLWKTISVWIDIIKKKRNEDQQRDWIANNRFILLSNKDASTNDLWIKIQAFQKDKKKYNELELFLDDLYTNTSDSKSKDDGTIIESDKKRKIRSLIEYPLKKEFLENISIEFKTDDDIIEEIKHNIRFQHNTPQESVHNCMVALFGELACSYKNTIQKGQSAEFDEKSFDQIFGKYFHIYKTRKFVPIYRNIEIPEEPLKQTFMKQLIEIRCVKATNIDMVRDYTSYRIHFENSYNNALTITGEQGRISFEREVKQTWRHHFEKENIDIEDNALEADIISAARKVVWGVLDKELKFEEDCLNKTQSNGCFFYFSDGKIPKIGWRNDWKDKYNGEEWTIE